ncbi:MAG: EamA family transporter RarD, partial [Pontibacterium sp.]
RVAWALLFTAGIIILLKRSSPVLTCLRSPKSLALLFSSAVLIALNWGVFIYAVQHDDVLSTSLGYFITPLVSVALGALFLRERLTRWQKAAVSTATLGILFMVYAVGTLPWVSLALAGSFGIYGLVRKQVPTDTLTGLLVETAMLCPFALGYWAYLSITHQSHFVGFSNIGLLILMGLLTSLPLLMFAQAAKKLSLATLGFLGYIAPTGHFFLAFFYFKEPLALDQLIAFMIIWVALFLFSFGSFSRKETKKVI